MYDYCLAENGTFVHVTGVNGPHELSQIPQFQSRSQFRMLLSLTRYCMKRSFFPYGFCYERNSSTTLEEVASNADTNHHVEKFVHCCNIFCESQRRPQQKTVRIHNARMDYQNSNSSLKTKSGQCFVRLHFVTTQKIQS